MVECYTVQSSRFRASRLGGLRGNVKVEALNCDHFGWQDRFP